LISIIQPEIQSAKNVIILAGTAQDQQPYIVLLAIKILTIAGFKLSNRMEVVGVYHLFLK
jgi:hypothetical protein